MLNFDKSRHRTVKFTSFVLAGLSLATWLFATAAVAGNVINLATTGASGSAITISNAAPTQLLKANPSRYGWTIFCAGTAGAIAVMVMPGDSGGNAANPAPSQTAGFPLLANTMITNQDFPLRGLDAIHQRLDAEAVGGAPVSCYSWEEQ